MAVHGANNDELFAIAERLADLGSWELRVDDGTWTWSDGVYRTHGLEPGAEPSLELFASALHPDDRDRVLEVIANALSRFEKGDIAVPYRVVKPDGSIRFITTLGRTDTGSDGVRRWYGVARDVTGERQAERDLQAHYEVSQALRDWQDVDDGLAGLLRRLGSALECQVGVLWTLGARGRITARAVWSPPEFDLGEFTGMRSLTFAIGEGLPGRTWEEARPRFVPDVTVDPLVHRGDAIGALGLTSALAFPAITDDGVIAVLSFYSADRREQTERIERTVSGIGHQLGRFLARRRAQLEPSPLSAREREVLKLAAEGLSGPKIAQRLVVSPSTVKTHFENIYEKLGVSDRGGAVAVGLRMGLIA